MVGASAGELIVPLYIGACIDLISDGDFDGVGTVSGYMLIVVIVSFTFPSFARLYIRTFITD